MKRGVSSKWPKLIWIIVIIAAFTIYADKSSASGSSILGIFGFFFVGWGIALIASIVVFLLRLFRILQRWSFFYIFVAVAAPFFFGFRPVADQWLSVRVWFLDISLFSNFSSCRPYADRHICG
jgi:hypothetical protein